MVRLSAEDDCDVAVVGAGIGGLTAAAVLSSVYGYKVAVHERHYHIGGCAHSFPYRSKSSSVSYQFDAGPTILLGCSTSPFNPLRQVLNAVGAESAIDWIPYSSWGMYAPETGNWQFSLGEGNFEREGLRRFGGDDAVLEFRRLRQACEPLCAGAASIPTLALRGDGWRLLPLLPHFSALQKVLPYSDVLDGNFAPLIDDYVKNEWLRAWLDALAFSLSGLPAKETSAAALAYTIFDLHRPGACLDYPRGGIGRIAETLRDVILHKGGSVNVRSEVTSIGIEKGRAGGLTFSDGRRLRARRGVICNADIWTLSRLLQPAIDAHQLNSEQVSFVSNCDRKASTKSFLHLHLGLNVQGLNLASKQPHYTIMHKTLSPLTLSSGVVIDACSDRNMVAVSNPCVLDQTLTSNDNFGMVHAYGAGNEDFRQWTELEYSPEAYQAKKRDDGQFLYESVALALGIDVQELKERIDLDLVGTPLTHRNYLARYQGTYGVAWKDALSTGVTPINGLVLAGDSVFPGIGVPAVAVSGASAANSLVNVIEHMVALARV